MKLSRYLGAILSRVHFEPRSRVRSFERGLPYSILLLAFAYSLLVPGRLLGQQMVGVARVDITPDYPIRLNGFGFRRAESEGVRQPIWAKALAIGSDDTAGGPAILIVIDTLGIPDAMTRELAQRLLPLGIQPDRLAIMTTHTHTSPMIQQVAPTLFGQPIPPDHQQHIDRYTKEFSERLFAVSQAALKDRRPAKLRWGHGRVGFAANRRTAGGPVDHDLPMLAVYDEQGALRAVWTTYACHCVTLSENLIGGDWAGYAQSQIERLFPGCTAMVSIGCGADANPASGVTGDKADVAESQGLEIAREVRRLLEHPLTEITQPLTTKLQRIELPLAPLPSRDVWQERAAMTDAIGYHAKVQLARLDRGEKLLSSIEYPVQTWTFGDQLAMIFLPGEVVVDYAIRLKSEQDGSRIWINGYSNHCPGYVPSERILREGGYEGGGAMVYYDIPGPYATGVEQKIVSEVQNQLGDAFQRRKPAQGTQGRLPLPPNEALASLKTHDDLQVELVASEPLVTSPVAIAFGLDGRLWIAEMYDYPTGLDGKFGKGGRVKVLRDTNHDGRMDDATVFLDSIPFPTGITVWRDGVLVCAAPDIMFARDTNGDGRADEIQRLYHGFGTDNYQARVNSLEYGLDGWVYGSCGLFGGSIETITGKTIALGDRDFRIRPDAGWMEPASGRTQQGRVRNDRGDWFGCDNSNLVYHYPLQDHDLRRNPYLIATETLVHLAPGEAGATLYPISQQVLFKLSGPAGRITAGCGLGIYRDNYLGPQYTGNAFTCEPVNNLVHRQVIQPDGVTYRGHRASDEADREFLSSADPWFRPVQARTGPDGGLWIVDMYRYVIEHPRWIPPESLDQLDVRAGADFGRIYRVVRRDAPPRPAVNLNQATPIELVSALDSPNGTLRDLATQQLIWKGAPASQEVTSALSLFLHSNAYEWTRLHALTALDQLHSLTIDQVSAAMQDSSSSVRRQAVRLAADPRYVSPALQAALLRLEKDQSAEVRQEVAVSLGSYPTNAAATTLGRLLLADDNTISRTAALSSLSAINLVTVVKTVLANFQVDQHLTIGTDLFTIAGAMNDAQAITEFVHWIDHSTQLDTLSRQHLWTGFFNGRQRANLADAGLPDDVMKAAGRQLTMAREVANQESAATQLRESAIRLLGEADLERDANRQALFQLLSARASAELADASVRALESQSDNQTAEHLLRALADASPKASEVLIGSLLTRGNWTQMLLAAIETDKLPRSLLGATEQARLRESEDESIRARAATLFEDQSVTGLADLNEYLLAAKKGGDADRGREVFTRQCASCHRWQETGQAIGPDIASYAQKPIEALLVAVLDPNQAIDPRYVNYNLTTTDGRIFSGIIQQETATSLTLADGKREATTLARTQIDYLQRTGLSLMPTGLAREITPVAMADLIAFLMGSESALGSPTPAND